MPTWDPARILEDFDRNWLIEASAGAGKTWFLTKYYLRALNSFVAQYQRGGFWRDERHILVITFTRQAAGDMARRIFQDLNAVLSGATFPGLPAHLFSALSGASPEIKARLRANFAQHAISTIDAFCVRILRDHAVEAEIDPDFTVADETELQELFQLEWDYFLSTAEGRERQLLESLLKHLQLHNLESYLKLLWKRRERVEDWVDRYSRVSVEQRQAQLLTRPELDYPHEMLVEQLKALLAELPPESQMAEPNNEKYRALQKLRKFLENPPTDERRLRLELVWHLRGWALKDDGQYYSQLPSLKKAWPTPTAGQSFREGLKAIVAQLQTVLPQEKLDRIPREGDLLSIEVLQDLARLYRIFVSRLQQRLEAERMLTFADILLKTHHLLRNHPAIARAYGQRYRYLLVDEFQDTNDLRWAILELIAQENGRLRQRGILLVGDPKQSIYRFQNADVTVMHRARERITATGGEVVPLNVTFRSTRKYLEDFINPVMSRVFANDGPPEPYEATFSPTTIPSAHPLPKASHRLGLVILEKIENDSEEWQPFPAHVIQTAYLAREMEQWAAKQKIAPGENGLIGILFRKFTNIDDYIQVFTRLRLNFEVLAGRGLFRRQETYDLFHLVSALANPLDDAALVGILRSPIFCFTDAQLDELRRSLPAVSRGWVIEALKREYPEVAEEILHWRRQMAHIPLDRLLEEILSSGERPLGWASEIGGDLRLANLDRLIYLLHKMGLSGLPLGMVRARLNYLIEEGEAPQAESTGGAPIKLLTVHRSKGLEFPLVILPELHTSGRGNQVGLTLRGFGRELEVGITLDSLEKRLPTSLMKEISEQDKRELEAEDKRLFYVAVTRAIYGLGMVTVEGKSRSSGWWQRYVEPRLPEIKDTIDVRSKTETEILERFGTEAQTAKEPVQYHWTKPHIAARNYREITPHTLMNLYYEQTLSGQAPGKEYLLDEDGLPEGTSFGLLVHKVMEHDWWDLNRYRTQIEAYLERQGVIREKERLLQDLDELSDHLRQNAYFQELRKIPPARRFVELPLVGWLKGQRYSLRVSGVVDLLYEQGGEWRVVDYKTDAEIPPELATGDHPYWIQLQTYLWMIKQNFGLEARGEIFFVRQGKVVTILYEPERYFELLRRWYSDSDLDVEQLTEKLPPEIESELLDQLQNGRRTVIVTSTTMKSDQLSRALAGRGLLTPGIQVLPYHRFRKVMVTEGAWMEETAVRLGMTRVLKKETGKQPTWGIINRAADAVRAHYAWGAEWKPVYRPYLEAFKNWCTEHDLEYPTPEKIIPSAPPWEVILTYGLMVYRPEDLAWWKTMEDRVYVVKHLPLLPPEKGLSASSGRTPAIDPDLSGTSRTILRYADVDREAEDVARRVALLLQNNFPLSRVKIAVSNMERYVPVLKRWLEAYGIPWRIRKQEPVLEHPLTQLLLTWLRFGSETPLRWSTVAALLGHPLFPPAWPAERLWRFEAQVREQGWTFWEDVLQADLRDRKLREEINTLLNGWRRTFQAAEPADKLALLRSKIQEVDMTDNLPRAEWTRRVGERLNAILERLEGFGRRFVMEPDWDWEQELRLALEQAGFRTPHQWEGVDIISFLDAAQEDQETRLFILGLNEGDFPPAPITNPWLYEEYSPDVWGFNLDLLKLFWARPSANTFYSFPLKDAAGDTLQPSSLLELVPHEVQVPDMDDTPSNYRRYVLSLAGHPLQNPQTPWQTRHNAWLQGEECTPFSGATGRKRPSPLRLSVSAFEVLYNCPQRYWFQEILGVSKMDGNRQGILRGEVGKLVHELLRDFGARGGFELLVRQPPEAYRLLGEVVENFLAAQPQWQRKGEFIRWALGKRYLERLEEPEENVLRAFLENEQRFLKALQGQWRFEIGFSESGPLAPLVLELSNGNRVVIAGRIDRLLLGRDYVWISDYKTGEVRPQTVKNQEVLQPLLYCLALKRIYPRKRVLFSFVHLKDLRKKLSPLGLCGEPLEEVKEFQKCSLPLYEVASAPEDLTFDDMARAFAEAAGPVFEGNFPLTSGDQSKICKNCYYDRLCRRTTWPR